jgi:hypothetical protein
MHTRRAVLRTLGGVSAVGLAGCSFFSGPIEQSASPAGIPEDTHRPEGFEHRRTDEFRLEQTVDVAGESRDLRLTNYIVEYGKRLGDVGPRGVSFLLFTSPSVTVGDQEANPFVRFDSRQLIEEILGRAGVGATNIQEVGTEMSMVLGRDIEFRVQEAMSAVAGQDIPIRMHFGRRKHEGDLVGILGTYPGAVEEANSIYTLAGALEHPAEFVTQNGA